MVYPIVKLGDPVLEREAEDVTEFDTPELHKFLEDMFQSMYAAKGVGLAAPQIGFSRKISVIDVSNGENPADKLVLINPQIVRVEGKQEGEEGCLSIPGFRATRELNVTAHVTRNEKGRRSNLDRRTTRHPGYAVSLSRRWLIEKGFGWLKQTGPMRQVKLRGLHKVDWLFVFSCAAHNLMRLPRLIAQRTEQGLRQQCA